VERIGIYDARARLSELVERVQAGEEVILTKRGEPVARLVAETPRGSKRRASTIKRVRALSRRLNLKISRTELRKAISQGRD
jgi:prevent-host-death family protein